MIQDTLRLEASPELFLSKTLDDLEFADSILEFLTASLTGESGLPGGKAAFDHLADSEWQFSQLLTEIMGANSPFRAPESPWMREKLLPLRANSAAREARVNETGIPAEQVLAESQVSSAELSELLRGF